MYIDSRPSRRRAGVSTFGKSPSCDGSITGHTSWVFLFARCTKGIVHARRTGRGRELYGTNFRHAVEFSRSGRTPSQPFRADRGQPEIRYLVSSARSNTGSRPDSHLVGAREVLIDSRPRASCLGEHSPGPGRSACLSAGLSFRLRPANKENISRASSRDANPRSRCPEAPCLLGFVGSRIVRPRSNSRVGFL